MNPSVQIPYTTKLFYLWDMAYLPLDNSYILLQRLHDYAPLKSESHKAFLVFCPLQVPRKHHMTA